MVAPVVKFTLHTANWRDLKDLRRLEKICFGDDAWMMLDLIAVLILPNIVRIKACVGGKMTGFIVGESKPQDGVGWISTLGVLPDYRRLGIAAALLAQCESQLAFPRIRLSVRKGNEPAIRLYRSTGYEMVDYWRNYYHSGEDALVLEKRR